MSNVHFICGFAAGSGADIIVRFFADKMRPLIGRSIIVENKVGAIGNLATEYVARAKPDGYTIYVTGASGLAANMHIFKNPSVDVAKELQVAATINKATYSGNIDYALPDNIQAMAQQRAGRMRILAVGSGTRMQSAPDLPTMTELGYPMDVRSWWAALVPAATPRPVVDQLNAWFSQVVATEEARAFLAGIASDPWVSKPDEGQAYLREQIKDWGDYVRLAKIEPQG